VSAEPRRWAVVPFKNTYQKQIDQRWADWDTLVKTLTTFRICETKDRVPAWSPVEYKAGATRGSAGVLSLSCLVLDYDTGAAGIQNALNAWGSWPGILHTSWSHTKELHKFRVIMPLNKPVAREDWPGVFAWAERWTRTVEDRDKEMSLEEYLQADWIKTIDPACKDPGRIFYVPAVRSDDWPKFATSWIPEDRPETFLGTYSPWALEVRDYRRRAAELAARRAAPPKRTTYGSAARSRQAKGSALKTCPHAREALGVQLGGKVSTDRVGKVMCPKCARPSVWWIINPASKATAECDHLNSCGWWGHLDLLAAAQ
jgi:hypothetical protein